MKEGFFLSKSNRRQMFMANNLRLLVMNKQRLIQKYSDGHWSTERVGRAGELKSGVYNLFDAKAPCDKEQSEFKGIIIYISEFSIYQYTDKGEIISHELSDFLCPQPKVDTKKMIGLLYDRNRIFKVKKYRKEINKNR